MYMRSAVVPTTIMCAIPTVKYHCQGIMHYIYIYISTACYQNKLHLSKADDSIAFVILMVLACWIWLIYGSQKGSSRDWHFLISVTRDVKKLFLVTRDCWIPHCTWLQYVISRDTWYDILFSVILPYILNKTCLLWSRLFFSVDSFFQPIYWTFRATTLPVYVEYYVYYHNFINLISKTSIWWVIALVRNTCTFKFIISLISSDNKSYILIFRITHFFKHFI